MSPGAIMAGDWFPRPLPANIELGERSWLHSAYAFLHYQSRRRCGLRVGADSGMYAETFFDLGPDGEVEIGACCTLAGPVIATNRRIVIGDYVLISREVVIADEAAAVPAPTSLTPSGDRAPSITIGDLCWIGSRAVVLAGANLGVGVIVGAGAMVDSSVPPFAIVAGNPSRIVGWAPPAARPSRRNGSSRPDEGRGAAW